MDPSNHGEKCGYKQKTTPVIFVIHCHLIGSPEIASKVTNMANNALAHWADK